MKHHDQIFLGVRLKKEEFTAESSHDLVHDLLDPTATQPSGVSPVEDVPPEDRQAEFEVFSNQVRGLVAHVNRSVGAAQESDDIAIRKRELENARTTIAELRTLAERHPSLTLERLQQVMSLIELINRETNEL
jgi:hypothetical protein